MAKAATVRKGQPVEADKSTQLAAAAMEGCSELGETSSEPEAKVNKVISADFVWCLGSFLVTAKNPSGFWRSGVQFLHSAPTRVFVVASKEDVPADHSCTIPCCYLTPEEAKRVHSEPWLTIQEEPGLDEQKAPDEPEASE
ncbi:hypothetical protein C7R88_02025 [Plesiomonas shigelloides]|uniref:hypothetical protein n=1 Tax=Plesiomonas shigelloides TaxID=703 RepID=UPI000D1338FE|nr:hypothetical protein [Plesiomonas shigelloides]AVQ86192.1 hypothetical protein C7R88_02025 [Plesiomonas shigelloides]